MTSCYTRTKKTLEKLKQIRICLLEKIESFLHVMPTLLKADRLFHTLYVANSSFQANDRVCAVLAKQQQNNPHDLKGRQKKKLFTLRLRRPRRPRPLRKFERKFLLKIP